MVGAMDFAVYGGAFEPRQQPLRYQEIVDAPSGVTLSRLIEIAPPCVSPRGIGMQVTERVDKSGLKKQLKLAALLIGISGRPPVSVRVDQIDVTV